MSATVGPLLVECLQCGHWFCRLKYGSLCSQACREVRTFEQGRLTRARTRPPKYPRIRPCLHCGSMFDRGTTAAGYCSAQCRSKRTYQLSRAKKIPPPRSCPWCHTEFVPFPRSRIYCRQKCQSAAAWAKYHPVPAKPMRTCRMCKQKFRPRKGLSAKNNSVSVRYCSVKCRNKYWNRTLEERRLYVAGEYFSRKREPQLFAVAQRIRETKALLKTMKEPSL